MPARSRGFTLLELLVSMVVIGVLAGMIAVSMNPSPVRQARQEAGALVHLLQQLREYAVVNSQEYGLRIGAEGYQVMVFERPDWRPAGGGLSLTRRPVFSPGAGRPSAEVGRPGEPAAIAGAEQRRNECFHPALRIGAAALVECVR